MRKYYLPKMNANERRIRLSEKWLETYHDLRFITKATIPSGDDYRH